MRSSGKTYSRRIAAIDVLRGGALAAMAAYHFFWDLEFFGLANPDVTGNRLWVLFAYSTAGSFLALVGVSLVLAHGEQIQTAKFLRRLAAIAIAAGAITFASSYIDPEGIIFFGILHCIAVSSLLALLFLRLPIWVVLACAGFCFVAPALWTSSAFNDFHWLWLGLASEPLASNDYVPLLPWFGAVLLGVAMARLARAAMAKAAWARWQPQNFPSRLLAFAGRHSLLVYLVHQPLLLGVLWAVTKMIAGAA